MPNNEQTITISMDNYIYLKNTELKYIAVLNALAMDAVIAGEKVELSTYRLQELIRALEPELIDQLYQAIKEDEPF